MDAHLHHKEQRLTSNAWLSDIAIGMSDGLIVPFALAAGLSGAVTGTGIIVVAGMVAIAAGSIAMGLGGYFSGKTEQDDYTSQLKREYDEVNDVRHNDIEQTKEFFANLGLSEELQEQATQEVAKDKDKWTEFIKKYELAKKPDPNRATKSAWNIGLSYVIGGLVPLSPYFFTDSPSTGLKYSVAFTLICLFIFGWFKSKLTGVHPLWGAVRITMIATIAAAAAFGVAKIFQAS
jgi:vacuolar iron transporter family protein